MASRSISSLRQASRLLQRTLLSSNSGIHQNYFRCSSIIGSAAEKPFINQPQFSLYSTLRRHQPARTKKLDIGAKARQLQTRRLWTYALAFSGIAGFLVLVLNNFQDQLVFYVTPTDALEKLRENPNKTKFRLGGLVLEGSVSQPASSAEMEFVVTDLLTDILVRYQGSLPDLFREGHSVVVEGFVKPMTDEIRGESSPLPVPEDEAEAGRSFGRAKEVTAKARSGDFYFAAAEVLAKHDEKYMPAEVAAAIEKNKKTIQAEADEAAEEKKKQTAVSATTS